MDYCSFFRQVYMLTYGSLFQVNFVLGIIVEFTRNLGKLLVSKFTMDFLILLFPMSISLSINFMKLFVV